MPDANDVVVNARVTIPAAELSLAFSRSGGPGGQNVNKVASKVDLRWQPRASAALSDTDRDYLIARLGKRLTLDGMLIVTSSLTRDQLKNRADALRKLAMIVRAALDRPTPRKPTKISRGAKRRRVEDKRHRGGIKAARKTAE